MTKQKHWFTNVVYESGEVFHFALHGIGLSIPALPSSPTIIVYTVKCDSRCGEKAAASV